MEAGRHSRIDLDDYDSWPIILQAFPDPIVTAIHIHDEEIKIAGNGCLGEDIVQRVLLGQILGKAVHIVPEQLA